MQRKFGFIYGTAFRRLIALSVPVLVALLSAITWPPERTWPFLEPVLAPLRGVEWNGYDTLFHWRGPTPADPRITVVGIETSSLETLKSPWPIPRRAYAKVLRNLVADGAKTVCFDILMPRKSPYGPADDRALHNALAAAGGKAILACRMNRGGTDIRKSLIFPYYDDALGIDFEANATIASADILTAPDRYVRLCYPLQKFQGEWLPSLPAAAYLALVGGDIRRSRLTDQRIYLGHHPIPRTGPTIPDPDFPENTMGSAYPDFPGGSRTFDFVRFENVLNGEFPPGTFKDKAVFIGVTDIELAGELNDTVRTAYSHYTPEKVGANFTGDVFGVVVQAQFLHALLRNGFIRMASPLETFLLVFGFGLIANFGIRRFLNWRGPALIALAIIGFIGTVFFLFVKAHVFVPFVVPSALILSGTAGVAWLERGEILRKWSANVSPAYLEHMMRYGDESASRRYDATVIFGDIRGFTNFSSHHEPERVIDLLDKHLDKQVKIVFEEEGTVDKFLGDGIMVVFGAPNEQPDRHIRAVRAAWRMRAASFETLYDELGNAYHLREGFGIASGPLVLGFVGSRRLNSLTTIGDTVNLAARLQGVTGDADIVIDQATFEKVRDHVVTEEMGPVAVKGKDEKILCWRVVGLKDTSDIVPFEEKTPVPSKI
ncbi:MAG: adenylate/guanylate cyclase domain-containing protein [Capsulimonadales bacterium]|nr:adenylate/guanylate cyclase domain-containing protein [Capsulimonadales bacterium]